MKEIIIHKTTDYDLFSYMEANRKINYNKVKKLTEEMRRGYIREASIITVNRNLQIIDGQHRFEALKELGKPIYYQVSDIVNNNALIVMNNFRNNWNDEDFLNAHLNSQNPEVREIYKELVNFRDKNNLKTNEVTSLLGSLDVYNYLGNTRGSYKDKFIRGNLTKLDINKLEVQLGKVRGFYNEEINIKFSFANYIVTLIEKGRRKNPKKYDYKKIISKLKNSNLRNLQNSKNRTEIKNELEHILNFRVTNANKYNLSKGI